MFQGTMYDRWIYTMVSPLVKVSVGPLASFQISLFSKPSPTLQVAFRDHTCNFLLLSLPPHFDAIWVSAAHPPYVTLFYT